MYDARSTSTEKVDSGAEATERKRLSSMREYSSVFHGALRARMSPVVLRSRAVSPLRDPTAAVAVDVAAARFKSSTRVAVLVTTTCSS